jgi:hypothetical protein
VNHLRPRIILIYRVPASRCQNHGVISTPEPGAGFRHDIRRSYTLPFHNRVHSQPFSLLRASAILDWSSDRILPSSGAAQVEHLQARKNRIFISS